MESTLQFAKVTFITTFAVYVVIAGLFAIAGVLGWTTWELIGEWLGRIAIIAGIVVVLSTAVAFLLGTIRRS